jgi:hypothetical protein
VTARLGGLSLRRADALIAAVPSRSWQKISAGTGAHGPRLYDWARLPVRAGEKRGRGYWLLARRSLAGPAEIAYNSCYGPSRCSTADLAWTAGSRWQAEECFQQAKGETGPGHYQVRTWRAWYAHITLSMLALAGLAASRVQAGKGGLGAGDPGMIGYTLAELRSLLNGLVTARSPDPDGVWSWSSWRRRRQYQARLCHYRRRGYPLTRAGC